MLSRFVGIGIVLVALTTLLGAGFVVANQSAIPNQSTIPPSSKTTSSVMETQTVITQQATQTFVIQQLTTAQPTTQQLTTTTTTTQTSRNGTIGVYYQAANYTIVPAPVYLGSHYDLFIPMHVMDWYTVSCGTQYYISGTLYWYNYSASGPSYHGVGNLEVYANAAYKEMISGSQILSFASGGSSNATFSSPFTAC